MPWALDGVDLGAQIVEIGPGYGATTQALLRRVPQLTAVEIDPEMAARLRDSFSGAVTVVHGDGTSMPLQAGSASGVVCFTMLHHVPSPQLQDRLFADAYRVLRPGGVFAGSDSVATPLFRLLHVGDTLVAVDPITLPARLRAAGFADTRVSVPRATSFRFRGIKP